MSKTMLNRNKVYKVFGLALMLALLLLPTIASAENYNIRTFADMGIKLNTNIYCITSARGTLTANGGNVGFTTSAVNTGNANEQFAFITPTDQDTTEVYLYNLGSKTFAKVASGGNRRNLNLVNGASGPDPVYVYGTDNATYNLAFSFSSSTIYHSTDAGGRNGLTLNISGNQLVVLTNYSKLDEGNRWYTTEATNSAFNLAEARQILRSLTILRNGLHYTGISKRPLMSNGMQDVAEVNYYYYVTKDTYDTDQSGNYQDNGRFRNGIELSLPFYDFNGYPDTKGSYGYYGNNMEPFAYFRWYDYRTDRMKTGSYVYNNRNIRRLVPYNTSVLHEIADTLMNSWGLFGYNLSGRGPNEHNVGVIYNIPDSADNADWQGDVIACDVSRYCDYNDSSTPDITNFTHEPTLSVRYIFHILPAKRLADNMENALVGGSIEGNPKTISDKALLEFGAKDNSSTMSLRTDLNDINFYYFHPLTADALASKHVYYPDSLAGTYSFAEGDFNNARLVQARSIEWRVYNSSMNAYRVIGTTSERTLTGNKVDKGTNINISLGANNATNNVYSLNGSDWKTLAGNDTTNVAAIDFGTSCYLVGYAVNGNDKCPFFNSRLDINNNYPMSDDQIQSGQHTERTTTYLSDHYGSPVAQFSFDNENTRQDHSQPTDNNSEDNFSLEPSRFSWRQYGFTYYQLGDWSVRGNNSGSGVVQGTSDTEKRIDPLHGDYIIEKYRLNGTGRNSFGLNDRTHHDDPSQYGYFMFTDASQESRMLGYQDFTGNLCTGSRIIISAWVSNWSTGTGSNQPELRFTLYGVEKDARGNDVSTHQLVALCSGNFINNIDGYTAGNSGGKWYQVYGVLTLPRESGVEQYNDFRITIDNFCFDTNGADYCIDDIRVYQSNSKLTILQSPAMCATQEERSHVILKAVGNYSILREQSNSNTVGHKLRFRFYDQNHQLIHGDNFYGPNEDVYGEFDVPSVYSDTARLDSVDGYAKRFELDNTGTEQLVLFNRHFDLSPDSIYYLSLQVPTGDHEWSEWGIASNICSFYSDNFQLVTQNLVIQGQENGRASVMVPCDQETISDYHISMGLTAPDKTNGGKITIPVPFDYYIGSRREFVDSHLDVALGHYRDEYPNSTSPDEPAKGLYTDPERTLLRANIYNSTSNPQGKVFLVHSTEFTGYPLAAGTDTIVAIATSDTITYSGALYTICQDPMEFVIDGSHDGPRITVGIPGVVYPSTTNLPYRSIRIGLPQIRQMGEDGMLTVPINGRFYAGHSADNEDLYFVGWDNNTRCDTVYLSATNDPSVDMNRMNVIAYIGNNHDDLLHTDSAIVLRRINQDLIHEGYWYELALRYARFDSTSVANCIGESYFRLKIVPEYVTWDPTVTSEFNSNWNVDVNWRRSTAAELYKPDYVDYRRPTYSFTLYNASGNAVETKQNPVSPQSAALTTLVEPKSYVPMYFTKVTIPYLANRPYPMMPYITYNASTHLILNMTNGKGNQATEYIQYDMMASPIGNSRTAKNFNCINFNGNRCAQIQFKTGAQMRMQQYLTYDSAWVDMEMPVNAWGSFTTPMMYSYSGEMYVPKNTARQTTEAFKPINFTDVDSYNEKGQPWKQGDGTVYGLFGKAGATMYSRIKMPVYQKRWGDGGYEYTGGNNQILSWDNPASMLIYPSVDDGDNIDLQANEWWNQQRNAWSHTFNDMRVRYAPGLGAAGKIGDDYATPTRDEGEWSEKAALIRLPKSDRSYQFYYYNHEDSTEHGTGSTTIPSRDHFKLGVPYDLTEDSYGQVIVYPDGVRPEDNHYYLIGNPYTSTIRVKDFVDANRDMLATVRRPVVVHNDETDEDVETGDSIDVYCVWVLSSTNLDEYRGDDETALIDPGRSFFVKIPRLDAEHYQLIFTTRMETDPALHMATLRAMQMQYAKKTYFVMSPEDVANAIEHGTVNSGFKCSAIGDGWISINAGADAGAWSAQIYSVDGRQIAKVSSNGDNRQVHTGSGMFIIRITKDGGTAPETFKLVVR